MQPSGSSRAAVLSGTIAGRFVILQLVGAGGMGQVYKAQDAKLKRIVAIKRMAPRLQENDQDRRRFLREAQQASALNHPNVAGIYDVFEENDEIFLIMEYVEGTPLRAAMQAKPVVGTEDFFRIASQGLEALNAAHEKGILHGDIKPENIMLTPEGRVKVLDFGVARRFSSGTGDEATLTVATLGGVTGGTPAYMAPEVLTQKSYDGRADLFSFGLVCYEMLGGRQPFETDSLAGTMASVLHTDPPPIEELNPKVSPSVSSVIQTMLAKEPAQRYSSARDVLVDLRRIEQGEDPVFSATGATRKRKIRWRPYLAAGIAIVAIAAILLYIRAFRGPRTSPSGSTQPESNQAVTLAILPFAPMPDNPKLTALGQGMVESISTKLSRLTQDRALDIIPADTLQQRHVSSIAAARSMFGATTGLTVRLTEDRQLLRLNYALINAVTGAAITTGEISVPATDAFGAEDDIAKGAVKALQLKLRPEEQSQLNIHGTDKAEAYKYYLQARGYLLEYTRGENIENAILMVGEALKLDPNFGQAKAALGEAYWRKYWLTKQGRWTQMAKSTCEGAVALGNAGPAGHVCLGLVNDGSGQYAAAATEFQRAVDLDPTNEDAYVGLALADEHQGSINDAERTYQRLVAIRPSSRLAYNSLGTFYLRRNEYDKAAAAFQRVIELAPEGYGAYVNLGATYSDMGRYSDALVPLKKSITIRPSYAAYDNLGTAYIGLDRFADAASSYQEAIRLNPQQHVTWGDLGDARKYLGQKNEAASAYRKAEELATEELKVNPRDPDVLSSLAAYYSNLQDREHALHYLQQCLQYGSNDKDILLDAAAVYNNLNDTGVAVEWLGKAVQAGYAANRINDLPEFRNLHGNPGYQQLVARTQEQK
jgi:serine/threonine protein kinase/tetratricopeptide (TPR) repeat protein